MRLNLGCGSRLKAGYINLDKVDYGQEVVRDILRGLPFDDERFDEVVAEHFLEHIASGEELFFVISEICRVLKPDGVFTFIVPDARGLYGFYPDHKSYWTVEAVEALIKDPQQGATRHSFDIVWLNTDNTELKVTLVKRREGGKGKDILEMGNSKPDTL